MGLTVKQRGVLKGMIVGATVTVIVIVGTVLGGPRLLSPEASASGSFALRTDVFIALWLGVSAALLARHRFSARGHRRRRTYSWYGNGASSSSNTAEHAGTDGPRGAGALHVGDRDARVLDFSDTGCHRSLLMRSGAIPAWLSRWCTGAGGRVHANVLPERSHAHRRYCRGHQELVCLIQ